MAISSPPHHHQESDGLCNPPLTTTLFLLDSGHQENQESDGLCTPPPLTTTLFLLDSGHQENQESDGLCTSPSLTTTLFLLDSGHQEKAPPSDIQENDVDKTLARSLKITPSGVDLSKFRTEVPPTFLGLGLGLGLKVQDPDNNNNDPTPGFLIHNSKRKSPIFDEEPQKKIRREPQVPSHLSTEFLRIIEPAQHMFLYRKCLTATDVHRNQNRLLVTNTENVRQFLTCDEEHEILSGENNYIEVLGVDCMGRAFDLRLSTWGDRDRGRGEASTSNNTNYSMETKNKNKNKKKMSIVFNRQWCDMLEANRVNPGDIAELWGFRRDDKFCLAANFIHK